MRSRKTDDKPDKQQKETLNDLESLGTYLSRMGDARRLLEMIAQAYTDGLHQGYRAAERN